MRELLLSFIAAARVRAADGRLRTNFDLGLTASQFPRLWFGAGEQDHRTVVLWTDADNYEQTTPEAAVDVLLAEQKVESHDRPPGSQRP